MLHEFVLSYQLILSTLLLIELSMFLRCGGNNFCILLISVPAVIGFRSMLVILLVITHYMIRMERNDNVKPALYVPLVDSNQRQISCKAEALTTIQVYNLKTLSCLLGYVFYGKI